MDDNPNLDQRFIEFTKRKYTGVFYSRFVLGLWVLAEGAIYRDVLSDATYYDDSTRPVGLLSQNGHLERWVSIDYGTANPCVFIDTYDDGTTLWAEREYYWDSRAQSRQKTDAEYVHDLVEFVTPPGMFATDPASERLWPGVIIDPSAASFRAALMARGFHVIDADNTVEDGIRRVSTLLARGRLRIHRKNCPEGIREMQTYSWDSKKNEKGVDQPLKVRDHWPDGIRYHVNTRIPDYRIAA
jgi:hypothetical protein